MLIFLDIDGVLRRPGSTPYQFEPDCQYAFEDAVRGAYGSEIVITSSWRETMSVDDLRNYFETDIGMRIVGVTPVDPDESGHRRYREILAYLEGKDILPEEWVAVDSEARQFPSSGCNVLRVDPNRGFDGEAAGLLMEYHAEAERGRVIS